MEINIRWGILGCATIAVESVIPAMINSKYCTVAGIASITLKKAESVANQFQIPYFYGSYQELLDDNEIEAVYIPLPNHLHVKWAIKALQAGKHVLVEKPVGISSEEPEKILLDGEEIVRNDNWVFISKKKKINIKTQIYKKGNYEIIY